MNVELSAEIRFRCPHCQKLFCTDSDVFVAGETADFECIGCQKDFTLNRKMSTLGLYETNVKRQVQFVNCPKCAHLKPAGKDECPQCGVFESKFSEIQKVQNPRLYELNKYWQVVLSDLTNDASHQKFLDLAQKQSALNFAAQKYNDLKKIIGHDSLIEKYLKQIEHRLEAHVQTQLSVAHTQADNNKSLLASSRLFVIMGAIGTVVLILNKIKPMFPNLNGLVVAGTVLSYGLWFTTRGRSTTKKDSNFDF